MFQRAVGFLLGSIIVGAMVCGLALGVRLGEVTDVTVGNVQAEVQRYAAARAQEAEASARIAQLNADERALRLAELEAVTENTRAAMTWGIYAAALAFVMIALGGGAGAAMFLYRRANSRAVMIYPDARGNFPIADANPALTSERAALQLGTQAQMVAAITAAARAERDAQALPDLLAGAAQLSQALREGASASGAGGRTVRRRAAKLRAPDPHVAPGAARRLTDAERDRMAWEREAMDLAHFIEKGSRGGFARAVWLGESLPSGRTMSKSLWSILRGRMLEAQVVEMTDGNSMRLIVEPKEAQERCGVKLGVTIPRPMPVMAEG